MKEVPPSRYRVVERGRRLEVIDTHRQGSTVSPPVDPRRPRLPVVAGLPRRTRFDGSAQLTTTAAYDDKAPRTIALDPASAAIVRWVPVGAAVLVVAYGVTAIVAAPWLLIALPLLADKRVWKPARTAITRWLDTVEREAG